MSNMSRFVLGFDSFNVILCVTCGVLAFLAGIFQTQNARAEDTTHEQINQKSDAVSADFTFVKTVFGSVVLVTTAEGPQKPKIFPNEHLLVQSDSFEVVKYAIARAKLYDVEIDVVETSQRYRFLSLKGIIKDHKLEPDFVNTYPAFRPVYNIWKSEFIKDACYSGNGIDITTHFVNWTSALSNSDDVKGYQDCIENELLMMRGITLASNQQADFEYIRGKNGSIPPSIDACLARDNPIKCIKNLN